MANTGYDYFNWNQTNSSNSDWSSTGNTTNTTPWFQRLRGPQYSVRQALLIVRETAGHQPQTYANIAGVQFKRITRRGKSHYYRAVR